MDVIDTATGELEEMYETETAADVDGDRPTALGLGMNAVSASHSTAVTR